MKIILQTTRISEAYVQTIVKQIPRDFYVVCISDRSVRTHMGSNTLGVLSATFADQKQKVVYFSYVDGKPPLQAECTLIHDLPQFLTEKRREFNRHVRMIRESESQRQECQERPPERGISPAQLSEYAVSSNSSPPTSHGSESPQGIPIHVTFSRTQHNHNH